MVCGQSACRRSASASILSLLNLQAGAGDIFEWDVISQNMADGDIFTHEGANGSNSESVVHVARQLLHEMHTEALLTSDRVAATPTARLRTSDHMRCPQCPFLRFRASGHRHSHGPRDLFTHLEGCHLPRGQCSGMRAFVPSGSKQGKVVTVLFDHDRLTHSSASGC